jgi:surface protein
MTIAHNKVSINEAAVVINKNIFLDQKQFEELCKKGSILFASDNPDSDTPKMFYGADVESIIIIDLALKEGMVFYRFANLRTINGVPKIETDNLDRLFYGLKKLKGDISHWNVKDVRSMEAMFEHSAFNGDISDWDVSSVNNMKRMFANSHFNGDISEWDTSNIQDMECMFSSSEFCGDISRWNTSSVKNMRYMFASSRFKGDISQWNVGEVKNMEYMFINAEFDGDISQWNIQRSKENGRVVECSNITEHNRPYIERPDGWCAMS